MEESSFAGFEVPEMPMPRVSAEAEDVPEPPAATPLAEDKHMSRIGEETPARFMMEADQKVGEDMAEFMEENPPAPDTTVQDSKLDDRTKRMLRFSHLLPLG